MGEGTNPPYRKIKEEVKFFPHFLEILSDGESETWALSVKGGRIYDARVR